MSTYIKGIGNISPQQSWETDTLLTQAFGYNQNKLQAIEPDYEQWIDQRSLRRMSRILRMGVAAAIMALKEAKVEKPDGIITGTAYGCLEDTGVFLTKMIEHHEQALNPTPFMQSTHNTIGSQIALLLQCQEYNQTYTHSAFSFESALLDAMMQLEEDPTKNILVGGIDEITPVSHAIQCRFGIFRKEIESTLSLFKAPQTGTINGEGAAYFVVNGKRENETIASLEAVDMLYKPAEEHLFKRIKEFVHEAGFSPKEIDVVLLGKSGDKLSDQRTDALCKTIFPSGAIGLYKHLCGEYPVASAFALWLGCRIIAEHHIPEPVVFKETTRPIKTVLIYNPYFGTHHSLILLKSCRDIL